MATFIRGIVFVRTDVLFIFLKIFTKIKGDDLIYTNITTFLYNLKIDN